MHGPSQGAPRSVPFAPSATERVPHAHGEKDVAPTQPVASLHAVGDIVVQQTQHAEAFDKPSLTTPPSLPPQAVAACRQASTDPSIVATFDVFVQESQSAIERACAGAAVSPASQFATTPTQRLFASLGDIQQMDDASMTMAFLLLSGAGGAGQRRMLDVLHRTLDQGVEQSLKAQRQERLRVQEASERQIARQQKMRWVIPVAELVGAVGTGVLLASAGPVGWALGALGAGIGAAGGAFWHRRGNPGTDLLETARAAARGATLGASLVALAGIPLVQWLAGSGSALSAGIGISLDLFDIRLTTLSRGTRVAADFVVGAAQFWQAQAEHKVRNTEVGLRVCRLQTSLMQQLREQALDSMTQLVRIRRQSLNQARQLMSRRSQALLRIQAQIRH